MLICFVLFSSFFFFLHYSSAKVNIVGSHFSEELMCGMHSEPFSVIMFEICNICLSYEFVKWIKAFLCLWQI